MKIIDKMLFPQDALEYAKNKSSRIENSFNQIFYEIGLKFCHEWKVDVVKNEIVKEVVTLGRYALNVRHNSLTATIREISKFITEYLTDSTSYNDGTILQKGIIGLYEKVSKSN